MMVPLGFGGLSCWRFDANVSVGARDAESVMILFRWHMVQRLQHLLRMGDLLRCHAGRFYEDTGCGQHV